jgi:RecA-family ATPase
MNEHTYSRFKDEPRSQANGGGDGGEHPEEPALPPLPLIDMSKWDGEPVPRREWAVLDRIPLRQTTLHSGEGAVGKSLIELHRSVAHVLGRDWLGTMPEKGPAAFIDAEDDDQEIHIRLDPILKHYGVTYADVVANGLHLMSFAGKDAVLGAPTRSGKIEPTGLYRHLFNFCGDIKPKSIAIASAANVFAGNENDRSQVQQFVSILTRLAMVSNGGLVLVSHPSLTGINSDTGLSGNTAWHNSVRARYYTKGVKPEGADEQPDNNLREIVFKKNNYGPISTSIALQYRDGLFLQAPKASSLDQMARNQQVDDVYLKELSRLTAQGQDLGPHPTAKNYAPTVIASAVEGIRKKELEAAQQRLLDAGKIHITSVGPRSKERKYIRPGPPNNGRTT